MSTAVAYSINAMACAEYSALDQGTGRYRPRRMAGAAMVSAARLFTASRRDSERGSVIRGSSVVKRQHVLDAPNTLGVPLAAQVHLRHAGLSYDFRDILVAHPAAGKNADGAVRGLHQVAQLIDAALRRVGTA